ncbi:MAG: hypothetical protein IKZ43_07825 [Acidaminococcaceae bacterium]|nr:hypothetical protein [Acidaminococcaceae bacterium]
MNKALKGLLAGMMAAALLVTVGCGGGDKKKDPAPAPSTKQTTTTQKQDKAPEVKKKVKPVPKSTLYKYALHLDDVEKLPPMTDEVIKTFEKYAKEAKLAPQDAKTGTEGIFVFNSSPVSKGAQVYTYRWSGKRPGHHASKFKNDKGKEINEQHWTHIDMTADAKTQKLRSVRVVEYDVTAATGEKGKLTEIHKETFK